MVDQASSCFSTETLKKHDYIQKTLIPQQNLLELIYEFSKVAQYKINTQKSAAVLTMNNSKRKL